MSSICKTTNIGHPVFVEKHFPASLDFNFYETVKQWIYQGSHIMKVNILYHLLEEHFLSTLMIQLVYKE